MWHSCLKAAQPLQEDSLIFTTKSSEGPGTYLVDLGRMKGWVGIGAIQWFELRTPRLEIQHPNYYAIVPWLTSRIYVFCRNIVECSLKAVVNEISVEITRHCICEYIDIFGNRNFYSCSPRRQTLS